MVKERAKSSPLPGTAFWNYIIQKSGKKNVKKMRIFAREFGAFNRPPIVRDLMELKEKYGVEIFQKASKQMKRYNKADWRRTIPYFVGILKGMKNKKQRNY